MEGSSFTSGDPSIKGVIKTKKHKSEVVASRMERFPENRKVKQIKGSSIERKFLVDCEKQMEALEWNTHSDQREDRSPLTL